MMPGDKNVKRLLGERKLAANKNLGQNFLIHRATTDRIVEKAGIDAEDTIIELGVGFGALTRPIAERARRVIGLEIDAGILKWHEEEGDMPENVTIMRQDILDADFEDFSRSLQARLKIMGNLPYSISNPLLFKLVRNKEYLRSAVLMLQKEVGSRLTAAAGTKEYGVLSILLGACASVETLMHIGPGQFHPRPKVDSVVVRITFDPVPEKVAAFPPHDPELLRKIVNAAFGQRRKTIVNALSAPTDLFSGGKDEIRDLLDHCAIAPAARAENLTVADFVNLTVNKLSKG